MAAAQPAGRRGESRLVRPLVYTSEVVVVVLHGITLAVEAFAVEYMEANGV